VNTTGKDTAVDKKKVLLLGLGMQGTAALHDLLSFPDIDEIRVVDRRPDLAARLSLFRTERIVALDLDLTETSAVESAMRQVDVVVDVLPVSFALAVGQAAAAVGTSLVSSVDYINTRETDPARIHAQEEAVQHLDRAARAKGVTILTEFGLDPGLDLVMGARACAEFDRVDEFHAYGAGIPDPRTAGNPLNYKFSWSAVGVMKAYARPASLITDGREVQIDRRDIFAPENIHQLDLPELGTTLECYPNSHIGRYAKLFGLQDSVREMGRYTCRLPGHCAFWRVATGSGFLDEAPVRVGEATIAPMEFTAALLESQQQFQYQDAEQDIALVRVDVRGLVAGEKRRVVYQLIDRRDPETGLTAMQRTVGFTLGLGARFILTGRLNGGGLLKPTDVRYEDVVEGMARHGIHITRQELPGN